jgi:hypothetical protein
MLSDFCKDIRRFAPIAFAASAVLVAPPGVPRELGDCTRAIVSNAI